PAEKILQAAKDHNVAMIGLSGLITPSLDEMVHVAKEMKRQSFSIPLLIGGATTSRLHTAVRIAPEYDNGVVHVLDASRSVTVAGNLLNKETKKEFLSSIENDYQKLKADFGNKKSAKVLLPFSEAQKNKYGIDWANFTPLKPKFTGIKVFDNYDLNEICNYIDWQPFYIAWEMHGKFPDLLSDEKIGASATKLYEDAQALLKKIISEKWLTAKGVIGFWETNKIADDTVEVKNTDGEIFDLEFLRQQIKKAPGQPNLSLADFIKPGKGDFIGAFAVSIHGLDPHIERFNKEFDDYNKIILQALADRLAEGFAELLHEKTRKEFWGYSTEEHLTAKELVEEKYVGIRPAPGYPACPDHTEKYKLFKLLNASENAGITLTESLAMDPAPSVCGWYFANPESKYFGVGKIAKDQLEDYARRKNMPIEEAEKWLRPQLE
ncbi:MAG TPA: vitamin B12 dependent-methionine synthase activation domain-containing protein, partial [Hanamia sp.]|nr:vitamin B12 dependent-methionine synthase activation domain-containing protein [Hanamia sp.]